MPRGRSNATVDAGYLKVLQAKATLLDTIFEDAEDTVVITPQTFKAYKIARRLADKLPDGADEPIEPKA